MTLCNGLSSIDKVCRVYISINPYIPVTLLVPSSLLSCTVPVSDFFKSTLEDNQSCTISYFIGIILIKWIVAYQSMNAVSLTRYRLGSSRSMYVVKWLSRRNCALIVFPCKLFASRVRTQARRHSTYIARAKISFRG